MFSQNKDYDSYQYDNTITPYMNDETYNYGTPVNTATLTDNGTSNPNVSATNQDLKPQTIAYTSGEMKCADIYYALMGPAAGNHSDHVPFVCRNVGVLGTKKPGHTSKNNNNKHSDTPHIVYPSIPDRELTEEEYMKELVKAVNFPPETPINAEPKPSEVTLNEPYVNPIETTQNDMKPTEPIKQNTQMQPTYNQQPVQEGKAYQEEPPVMVTSQKPNSVVEETQYLQSTYDIEKQVAFNPVPVMYLNQKSPPVGSDLKQLIDRSQGANPGYSNPSYVHPAY